MSSHFKKQKPYIERFQNDRLLGFKECVNRKLILEYEDDAFCQIEIPPFFTSNLIERTLCSLKNVLTRNNALLLITQWYRKRNSPGLKEFSLKEEWELFEVVLMSALGYRVEICNEYDERPIQAKKSKPSEQENKVWCSFLESAHHILIGEQVLNMLNLKQIRNPNCKRSVGVIFNYDCDNNEAALLLEFKTIFYSLHLLYEDLKLNQVFSDQLIYLATFLDKLSNDFSLNLYVSYYRNDFPSIIDQNNAKNRQLISNMNISDAVFNNTEPPNIMLYLYELLNNKQVSAFPYVKSVNPRCKHLIQIYMIILERTTQVNNQNNSIINNVVEYMTSVGITNEVLESFPVGVSLSIYEILWQCRNNPPINWSSQAYSLIYREDLQAQADINNELNDEENYKYSDTNVKVDCNDDDSTLEKRDGMEDIENSALKYQFTDDKRVAEVRKMLQSCGQVRIAIKQKPETTDHEFVEEQEKHLFAVCARTMSLPVGRGIFTLRTVKPVITETFPIPKLCLHGKSYPLGTAIDLSHIEIHSNMNMWPLFHNGVASGLRISHNASNINSTWILFNRPKSIGESATEHAGFLMALGLNGHLQNLNSLSLYEYLIKFNKLTSIGLLLGLSASKIGTMDNFVTKILSIHIDSLLPPTSIELDIPQDVQIASILGIGLLYQGTGHRYMSEIILNEIKRPPGPEMEHANDRDSYALTAGLALGMIALKHGSRTQFNDDLKLFDQLYVYIFGGRRNIFKERQKEKTKSASFLIREGNNINTNITAPGALMALALIYLDSNNENLASILKVPETQPLLECVRPDLLMLRTLAKDLIMWSKIEPKIEWVEKHIPEFMKPYCLKKVTHEEERSLYHSDIDYETMNQAFCNVVVGACFALGLRYAGTKNHDAFLVLKHYCKVFLNLLKRGLADLVGRGIIETCLNVVLVSMGLIMAGSGNVEILRICRFLRSKVGTNISNPLNYGSHMAIHMTTALLFMGGGRYSLSNSPSAVAALLCAFFPKYPSHSNDNRYHLQAFRHFYVLAAEPRLFITKSIVTNEVCFANIQIVMMNETELQCRAPCLLPPTDLIKKIQINDRNLLQIVFERDRNWNQLLDILSKNKFVCVKNKAKPIRNNNSLIALTKNSPSLPHFFYDDLKDSFINDFNYGLCIQNFVKCSQSLSDTNHFMKYLSIALHDSMNKDSPMALKFWIFIIKNLEKNPKTLQTLGLWQFKLMYAKILNPKINNVFIPIEIVQAVKSNLNQLDQNIVEDINNLRCSSTPYEISNQRTINYLLLNDFTVKELRCPSDIIHLLKESKFDLIMKICEM